MSGRESKVSFESSLADDSAGGVVGSGRIKVDNTLGERLQILEEKVGLTWQSDYEWARARAGCGNERMEQEHIRGGV
jgi:hypothetical protein